MKSKRSFVVPLSRPARTLVERAFSVSKPFGDDWAFPSPDGSGPIRADAVTRAMARAMRALGFEAAGPHDLRRTGRTWLTGPNVGVSYETAVRCLDHDVGGILARAYDQNAYDEPKRAAFEALGAELLRVANGEERAGAAALGD